MKKPIIPPKLKFAKNAGIEKFIEVAKVLAEGKLEILATYEGAYLHWDKLKYKPSPMPLSNEQWWFATKFARRALNPKILPFTDTEGTSFYFIVPDALLPKLAYIDRKSGGITSNLAAYDDERYIVNSLIEESISSSQLEGAATTRRIAKDMLLSQRKPRTEGELMIFNNYRAMQFIREHKGQNLSVEFILEVHRILTENILEDAGQLRIHDNIYVTDPQGEILHTPPKASELSERLKKICQFANMDETQEKHYIHPVIKGILLHFALAYDHPFTDGNGRTARALFYWFMLNRGYWLMEYISISEIIKKAPGQYGRAFLYTETDDNDTTYFIFHQIRVIMKAIDALYDYLNEQKQELQKVEKLLHNNSNLNHRQLVLIQHALKHPTTRYLIEHHRRSHNITYQTARTDLLKLAEWKLLTKQEMSNTFIFIVPTDLKQRLEKLH
jgi:Fic family protein